MSADSNKPSSPAPKPVVPAATVCNEAVKEVINILNNLSVNNFSEIVIGIMESDDVNLPAETYNSLIESLGKIPKSIIPTFVIDYLFQILENTANFSSSDWDLTNAFVIEALSNLIPREKVSHLTRATVEYLIEDTTNINHIRIFNALEKINR